MCRHVSSASLTTAMGCNSNDGSILTMLLPGTGSSLTKVVAAIAEAWLCRARISSLPWGPFSPAPGPVVQSRLRDHAGDRCVTRRRGERGSGADAASTRLPDRSEGRQRLRQGSHRCCPFSLRTRSGDGTNCSPLAGELDLQVRSVAYRHARVTWRAIALVTICHRLGSRGRWPIR